MRCYLTDFYVSKALRYIIFFFLFFPAVFPVSGQSDGGARSAAREQYPDLGLYYSWQENEARDGIYLRAYEAWNADKDTMETETGCSPCELESLSLAFSEAFWDAKDYDRAFYLGFLLEEKLPQVAESDFPAKREVYYKLGEAYYLFLDFHKSIELLEKALAPVPLSFDDHANLDALNMLGICYANIGQMDTSDEYFRATLLSGDMVQNRPIYNAYALSHLGCNAMLTGQYDKAIALSTAVWPVLREETDDYGHLAGMCYCRGRSYLEKGDFKQASVWIDSLVYLSGQDQYNPTKRIKQAHLLRADYYTSMDDARQAKLYNDSLVNVYRRSEEQYTSQYIARAGSQYNREKIISQSERLRISRQRLIVLSLVALLSVAVALVIFSLYRRKNAAYKVLAQKAREWAHENEPSLSGEQASGAGEEKDAATQDDERIMSLIKKEVSERCAYREAGLTAETLAERLGVHRNMLSRAINRTTGGNFNQYVNSLRIKEAIRIMQDKAHKDIRIDEIYEGVGFGNRTSFYRAFKQFTGLSPIDYLNSNR